jgi:hypothetical protein
MKLVRRHRRAIMFVISLLFLVGITAGFLRRVGLL